VQSLLLLMVLGVAREARAIIGLPFTPMSYAGVARRTARRMAWAGAATTAVAAPVTAVRTLPVGCAVGVPCGGAVYQPAYYGPTVVYVPY
jgi:hypothetical protein